MRKDIALREKKVSAMRTNGDAKATAEKAIQAAKLRLKLSEDDVKELEYDIQEEEEEEDATGSAATGATDNGATGNDVSEEKKEDVGDVEDVEDAENDEKDDEKIEKEIVNEEKELKKEEKEEDVDKDVKFKTKVPTTLLRGSTYSLLKADERGQVSLDAVVRDLEEQGFRSNSVE